MASVTSGADLRRRLSGEAHQKIRDAFDAGELIILHALAPIETRYEAEYGLPPSFKEKLGKDYETDISILKSSFGEKFLSFQDYCVKDSTSVLELGRARLQAALLAGRSLIIELSRIASGLECWSFMQTPLGLRHIASEFRLSEMQAQVLWAELRTDPGFEGVTKPAATVTTDDWTAPKAGAMKLSVAIRENSDPGRGGRPVAIETRDFLREWKRIGSPIHVTASICDEIAAAVLSKSDWLAARVNALERKKTRDRIRAAIRRSTNSATELVSSQD
jgi:hypothetical protein